MLVTADELPWLQPPDKRTELVRGHMLVREPAGFYHGNAAMVIAARLHAFVRQQGLGLVVAAETGFKLFANPDTVRAADAAYVRRERVPDPLPRGFAAFAPDLVVEVRSPNDGAGEVADKVADWLRAGTRLVWVIDPDRRVAQVHRLDGTTSHLATGEALDGEDVLPGFSCPLSEVL